MKKRIFYALLAAIMLVFWYAQLVVDVKSQAVTPTPVIIAGQDSNEAIADSDIVVAFRSGDTNPREVAVSRFRTLMQQGIPPAVPTATEKPNPTPQPTSTPQPNPTPQPIPTGGAVVDISGKLDVNLGNVRTGAGGVTASTRADFALKADLMRRDISNLNVASGQVSNAAEWRVALGVPRIRHQVVSTSTASISVQRGEEVYFTDTNRLFLALVSIAISPANILGSAGADSFREIHEALADVAVSGEYSDLVDRPFLYVAPGAALPTPDSGNEKYLLVAGTAQGRIIYHQVITHGSTLAVTYREFNTSDLDSGTYRGEVNYIENLPSDANNGDVYFVRNDHGLRIWNDTAGSWGNVFWTSGEWLGSFHSESAADQAVAAHYPSGSSGTPVGKHLSYGGSLSTQDLYTITAYTAAAADVRSWKPIFTSGRGGGGGVTEAEVDGKITEHNTATDAHADIRLAISSRVIVVGTPGDGQVIKWDEANSQYVPRDDLVSSGGGGEENVQADWNVTDTTSDAFIKNKPEIITTAPGAGDGGKLPSVSAADLRYLKQTGGNVGALTITGDVSISGELDVMGDMNIAASDVPSLAASKITSGNFNPQRLANNAPDAITTDVQFLSNNTATTARWRDLDGYVDDFTGALLATLTEFSYDSATNTLTFQPDSPVDSDHFKGDYDSSTTYAVGDLVEHESEFWIVANTTLANANAPANPVETTGWSQFSDRPGYRGRAPVESTLYHTGDTAAVPGEGVYLCTNGGNYTRAQIEDSASWVRFQSNVAITAGAISGAIEVNNTSDRSVHNFIVLEPNPENRLEFHDAQETRQALNVDTAFTAVSSDSGGIDFTQANGGTVELSQSDLQTAVGGLTQTGADARYLQLNPSGTTTRQTVQDPVTIDVAGNQEAFVIDGSEANNSAIFKITTSASGGQKAFQANRTGDSLAFLEFGGAVGGSGKAGIAVGSGAGGRDTNIYRDAANMWKTDDSFIIQQNLIVNGNMNIEAADVPNLDASKITSGTFDADRIPGPSAPTVSEWRRMSGGNPADLENNRVYYTNITPDSSALWIYVSVLYATGDNNPRAAAWNRILYSDWSGGDAVTDTDGSPVASADSHEYILFTTLQADTLSTEDNFDTCYIGRTSGSNIAVVCAIDGSVDPDIQGIRAFTE